MKRATFVAFICFAIPAAGQSTGASVSGIVTDASGARIVDATITIAHLLNGRAHADDRRPGMSPLRRYAQS
jgi:hypothetical protein